MNYWTLLICLLLMPTLHHAQSYSYNSYSDHASALQTAKVQNMEMAYLDQGEGPAIILVHGIPTNSWLYRKMINPLVEKGHRVIVPDMMGAGQSDKPKESEKLNFEAQASYLYDLLNHLQINEATLVVHDAGGPWSWNLLKLKDHPIQKVVLLNTILYPEGFDPPVRPKEGGLTHKMLRWAYGVNWMSKMIIKSTLKNGLSKVKLDDQAIEGYVKGFADIGKPLAGTFFGSLRNIEQPAQVGQSELKKQNIPMLAIWGEKDKILLASKQLPQAMDELSLKNSNVHILAGCNHFIQEEAPEQIVDYIAAFLK